MKIEEKIEEKIKEIVENHLQEFRTELPTLIRNELKFLEEHKPPNMSTVNYAIVLDVIKNNTMITKEDLINKVECLKNKAVFVSFKKSLPKEFVYKWFYGRQYPARFIYINNDKSLQSYAIKFFDKTKWGEPIIFSCPDRELKIKINKMILKLFGDIVTKQLPPAPPFPLLKGKPKIRKR